MSDLTHVIVEADGGSRGNPGPAAYGALVRDPATGEVIAQDGKTLGIATNNVAEYSGLIAGLELAAEYAPNASIEVRMYWRSSSSDGRASASSDRSSVGRGMRVVRNASSDTGSKGRRAVRPVAAGSTAGLSAAARKRWRSPSR